MSYLFGFLGAIYSLIIKSQHEMNIRSLPCCAGCILTVQDKL